MVVGSVSAQTLKVITPNGERDWSTTSTYPYYWMGDADNQPYFCSGTATVAIDSEVGALVISNTQVQGNNWDLQPFILDWFNIIEGEDYTIRVWLKAEMDGYANLSIGTWGASGNARLDFTQSDDFVMYSVEHTAAVTSTFENGNYNSHILWQMGETVGTVWIKKIQILQMGEDKPVLSEYGIWKPLINNSDMEGDDNSSFFTKVWTTDEEGNYQGADLGEDSPVLPSEISDGVGVDGTRGIKVEATEKFVNGWDNQFWFRFNEDVPSGTRYRVKFDYMADLDASVSTQSHAEPSDYIHYELFGTLDFVGYWKTYESEGSVSSQQSTSTKKFRSVAFNLNELSDANNYYFDNIYFDIYEPTIDVQFNDLGGCIQILFPYYTNTCRLMVQHAGGKKRLMMPTDCFKVKVDGEEVPVFSVEIDATGAIYVFIDEEWISDNSLSSESEVIVSFINPTDEFRLIHIDTANGEAVENFELQARYEESLDILPYTYGAPDLLSSDPEEGSFNLPNTISEFKVVFDKKVITDNIIAKLDNERLSVEPATGIADEITLKRNSTGDLTDGEHVISIDKVYGEQNLGESDYSTFEITIRVGAEVSQDLLDAITAAKTALAEKEEVGIERYYGEAYTALSDAVTKYENEASTYTAPSVINAAVVDLTNLVKAYKNHCSLVETYDEYTTKAKDLVDEYAETKYNTTELFLQLKALAEKYNNNALTDDEALTAAAEELKPIVDLCGNMFTEGESSCGDSGFKVLTDRIRQGVETLIELGASESDPLIVAARAAITDDDDIAEQLKAAITTKVYEMMKEPNASEAYFPVLDITEDDEGNEVIVSKKYNMTAFIKNPNIYVKQLVQYSPENVPGWEIPIGNAELNQMWISNTPKNIEGLPEDVAFTKYHSDLRMEQTITDLPVGVYSIDLNSVNWDEGDSSDGFCYVKTSDTPAVEEGEEEDRDLHFAGTADIQFWGQYVGKHDNYINEITVLDGTLTIGVHFGRGAQYLFDFAKLYLTAPAEGFDYASAYASVETAKTAKVRALQLFDLNGRQISKAGKGIVIVKKMMSDGTVKTEKVVK